MFCPKCGTQVADGATTCSSCGTPIAPAKSPAGAVADTVKIASQDALKAFKMFATNPVAGLSVAFEHLGPNRTLSVGVSFGVVFSLCILIGGYVALPGWSRPRGVGGFLSSLVCALVPFVSLAGASLAARKAFRGEGDFGRDCFVAGASLLPFGLVVLLAGLLGFGNMEAVLVLLLFAVCITILMLFAGCTRIFKMSERAATIAIPLMLIASGWLSKIIYTVLLRHSF